MKVAICAVAKNENTYIDEWVRYHIDLGYDRIYLFDNNDPKTPFVGDSISPEYRDRVEIIAVQGNYRSRQFAIYNRWLQEYSDGWDWCSFIDIDEFIVTSKGNIKDLLSTMPDECNFMILSWQIYGDDGVVEGDESQPVRSRFVKRWGSDKEFWNRFIKSTVRCGNKNIRARNAHGFYFEPADRKGEFPICHNCYGTPVRLASNGVYAGFGWHTDHYIAHYATKTISEFLKYKCDRIGTIWRSNPLKYFWLYNKQTPEKLAYIERFMAQQHKN